MVSEVALLASSPDGPPCSDVAVSAKARMRGFLLSLADQIGLPRSRWQPNKGGPGNEILRELHLACIDHIISGNFDPKDYLIDSGSGSRIVGEPPILLHFWIEELLNSVYR